MLTARRGIVTACDENYFEGLLLLHASVQRQGPYPIVAFDVGLTSNQLELAARKPQLEVRPLPEDPRIERIRTATASDAQPQKAGKRLWPLWICPFLIEHAPFDDVYWLDCDLVALRDLERMFDELSRGPVFTPENRAPEVTANDPRLYELAHIERAFDARKPCVNAGVTGWRRSRDGEVLAAYSHLVERASSDDDLRRLISWHDQGCLIWAIQKTGMEPRVLDHRQWNLCVANTSLETSPLDYGPNFLDALLKLLPETAIVHWNGCRPPWHAAEPNALLSHSDR